MCNSVGVSIVVLDIQVDFLKVHGPLLIEVIQQLFSCIHGLQRRVVDVDDRFISHNIMIPMLACMHNGVHLIVISGYLCYVLEIVSL